MSIINLISDAIFKNEKKSNPREDAKKRLTMVLIDDRGGRDLPDYLPKMQKEILEVLRKYIPDSTMEDVEFNMCNRNNTSIMEMSVSLDKARD